MPYEVTRPHWVNMHGLFSERKKQSTPVKEVLEKRDEEEWPLKDVIFVEDVKTVPVGKVLKVGCCRPVDNNLYQEGVKLYSWFILSSHWN